MIWPFSRRPPTPDLDPALWRQAAAGLPWLRRIERERDTRLRTLVAEFLQRIGRRKLIMPTYAALVKTPEGLALAEQVFAKARPGYHPITTGSVEQAIAEAKGATR